MFGILCFGDSITFSSWEANKLCWVQRLKNYFEAKHTHNVVYNLGILGDSTIELLKRINIEAKARTKYYNSENKFIITIAIGTNDLRGIDSPNNIQVKPEKYEKNLNEIIKIAKNHTEHIVLIGLPPVDESKTNPFEETYFTNKNILKYNNIIEKIANKQKLVFINIYNKFISEKNYQNLFSDGLHPNESGQELIFKIIKENLIIKKLID